MKEIVNRLHENRQIELAKSILESNGYRVSKKMDESKDIKESSESHEGWEYWKMPTGYKGPSTPEHYFKEYMDLYLTIYPPQVFGGDDYDDYEINITDVNGDSDIEVIQRGFKSFEEAESYINKWLDKNGYNIDPQNESTDIKEPAKSKLKDLWYNPETNSVIYDITPAILDIDDDDDSWIQSISEEDAQRVIDRYNGIDESNNGPRVGDKVTILRGGYKGQVGEIIDIDFEDEEGDQYSVKAPDGSVRHLDRDDIRVLGESKVDEDSETSDSDSSAGYKEVYDSAKDISWDEIYTRDDVVYIYREDEPFTHKELNKVWSALRTATSSGFDDERHVMWFEF